MNTASTDGEQEKKVVLVVDDAFRVSLAARLRDAGYVVLEAHDVESALHITRTHFRQSHLVLTGVNFDEDFTRLLQMYRPQMRGLSVVQDPLQPALLDRSPEAVTRQVQQFFGPRAAKGHVG